MCLMSLTTWSHLSDGVGSDWVTCLTCTPPSLWCHQYGEDPLLTQTSPCLSFCSLILVATFHERIASLPQGDALHLWRLNKEESQWIVWKKRRNKKKNLSDLCSKTKAVFGYRQLWLPVHHFCTDNMFPIIDPQKIKMKSM